MFPTLPVSFWADSELGACLRPTTAGRGTRGSITDPSTNENHTREDDVSVHETVPGMGLSAQAPKGSAVTFAFPRTLDGTLLGAPWKWRTFPVWGSEGGGHKL